MENKVNSAPTEGNFASINDKIAALETNKANKTELTGINNDIIKNTTNIDTNANNISTNKTNIQNLSTNKLDVSTFNDLEIRVASLEDDTTIEDLTTQIEECQKKISEIFTEIEAIKGRLDVLETSASSK